MCTGEDCSALGADVGGTGYEVFKPHMLPNMLKDKATSKALRADLAKSDVYERRYFAGETPRSTRLAPHASLCMPRSACLAPHTSLRTCSSAQASSPPSCCLP